MQLTSVPERLARAFSMLRGVMLVVLAAVLLIAPERAMPGSSSEPARSLGLMLASRTALLGIGLAALAAMAKPRALAWVLFADAALQVFDAGMALAAHRGTFAGLPAIIGGVEAWAAVVLLRGAAEPAATAQGHRAS